MYHIGDLINTCKCKQDIYLLISSFIFHCHSLELGTVWAFLPPTPKFLGYISDTICWECSFYVATLVITEEEKGRSAK